MFDFKSCMEVFFLLVAESTFGRTNTVTEEHLEASLLSAVEDKMKRRLKETFAQARHILIALRHFVHAIYRDFFQH